MAAVAAEPVAVVWGGAPGVLPAMGSDPIHRRGSASTGWMVSVWLFRACSAGFSRGQGSEAAPAHGARGVSARRKGRAAHRHVRDIAKVGRARWMPVVTLGI
ncbi:hypothetical protein GCM10010193_34970 [Kitasatospora atroaurantiaca]